VHETTERDGAGGGRSVLVCVAVGFWVRGVAGDVDTGPRVSVLGDGCEVGMLEGSGGRPLGGTSVGVLGGAVSREIPGPAGSTGPGSGGR
jgi:hypothetical protein